MKRFILILALLAMPIEAAEQDPLIGASVAEMTGRFGGPDEVYEYEDEDKYQFVWVFAGFYYIVDFENDVVVDIRTLNRF